MKDLPAHDCRVCGSPCRAVPIHHRDGSEGVEGYYCESDGCDLRGRNQLHYGKPGFRETEFRHDGSARHTAFGRPSQGEDNTLSACRTFVGVLRRDLALPLGEVEILDHNDHPGIDARAAWDGGGFLRLQVTRALPSEDYQAQAVAGEIEQTRGSWDSVGLLRTAIESKTERTSRRADISCITLLIDGRHAVDLAFLAAPICFDRMHGDWARDQGWESIWVVGPSFATRLDGRTEGLPASWPTTLP